MAAQNAIRVVLLLAAGVILFWARYPAAAQEADKQRLKDLFEFQWMASQGGQTLETAGDNRQLTFAVGAPVWFTSNADSSPHDGKNDLYYGPWLRADWREPLGAGIGWYIGANLVNYFYSRDSDRNYAYAEVLTGLTKTLAQTDKFSAELYAGLALDYNFTAHYGSDDFEPGFSLGAVLNRDIGCGNSFYLTPDVTFVRAFPDSRKENSYLSATLTPGWIWQMISSITAGAYWSGSAYWYPEADDEADFTQYLGASFDWQVTDIVTLGIVCVHTKNLSSRDDSDYSDISAGVTLRVDLPAIHFGKIRVMEKLGKN